MAYDDKKIYMYIYIIYQSAFYYINNIYVVGVYVM